MWAKAISDKTAEVCANAMKVLLREADLQPSVTHDLIHDAGKEWSLLHSVLPSGIVQRTKDPLDSNGIASLDKGIQSLKQTLEHIIEENGGNWVQHLQQAVRAYNRTPNSAVLGPPNQAENGASREFLIDQTNADSFEHDQKLYNKRSSAVEATKAFRTATGNKRSFNPQYGPKEIFDHIEAGRQYVVDDKGIYHLLKRILPVHAESEEPQGRLTTQRQYKVDTLRPLAEKIHATILHKATDLKLLSDRYSPKLEHEDERITFTKFLALFPELFEVVDGVVTARVVSEPVRRKRSTASGSKEAPQHEGVPPDVQGLIHNSSFSAAQLRRTDPVSAYITSYKPKVSADQRAAQAEAKNAKLAEAAAKKETKLKASVQREITKQQRQLSRLKPP